MIAVLAAIDVRSETSVSTIAAGFAGSGPSVTRASTGVPTASAGIARCRARW